MINVLKVSLSSLPIVKRFIYLPSSPSFINQHGVAVLEGGCVTCSLLHVAFIIAVISAIVVLQVAAPLALLPAELFLQDRDRALYPLEWDRSGLG